MKRLINVVGMGLSPEDLTPRAIKIIMNADILAGGKRHLSFFPDHAAQKVVLDRNVEATLAGLKKSCRGKTCRCSCLWRPEFFWCCSAGLQGVWEEERFRAAKHYGISGSLRARQGELGRRRVYQPAWKAASHSLTTCRLMIAP